MVTKRIIPCLDVRNGRVVKGTNFMGLRDVSNPVELAEYYSRNGADELVFYDITASYEGRKLFTDILEAVASRVFIPLTVGGGISDIEDFDRVLKRGADKVSVNSGALRRPQLIDKAAKKYGSQCVVLSVDVKRINGRFIVFQNGGRVDTGIDALEWIRQGVERGAGEVVLNSIDTDGVKQGFDIEMLRAVEEIIRVPLIASGGAGRIEDYIDLFKQVPGVSGGLAASIFHFGEVKISDLKDRLSGEGIPVRTVSLNPDYPLHSLINVIKFDERGLVPCIVQDFDSGRVLTLAYMNKESLEITLKRGLCCFWSRSRKELWLKGETSGNYQHVVTLEADCDKDAILVRVRKDGPACHLGTDSCFDSGPRIEF